VVFDNRLSGRLIRISLPFKLMSKSSSTGGEMTIC
jgi:hypothetical protein